MFELFPEEEIFICTQKAVADNIYKPKYKSVLESSVW